MDRGGGIVRLLDFSKIIFMWKSKSRSLYRTVYEIRRGFKVRNDALLLFYLSTFVIDFLENLLMIPNLFMNLQISSI